MSERKVVAIAMSGGVDSSVAASLLVDQGIEVFGLMARLWSPREDQGNLCCSPEDIEISRQIAASFGIPFFEVDLGDPFKEHVVDSFVDGYAKGITPNPCIACNRHIRWNLLLKEALSRGATHLATGHYARIQRQQDSYSLLRAHDRNKDQSYVLSVMGQQALSHAIFPLGEYTKDQVRRIARKRRLPVADRPESQDLCFVPSRDYRAFLQYIGAALPPPGPITDQEGAILGHHQGLANFTIGQRRGIGIPSTQPLYVLHKDFSSNTLIVGPSDALGRQHFFTGLVNWVRGYPPPHPIDAQVQVRYKSKEVNARIEPLQDGSSRIDLKEPLSDITPGQAAVYYDHDECLGVGIIQP